MSLSSELLCRVMTREDLPHVLTLQHLCYHPDFHEPLEAFESKLDASPLTSWVIPDHASGVAAYVVCLPVQSENYPALHARHWQVTEAPDELYVHDMAIAPTLRGRGTSQLLLQQARAHAAQTGLQRLSLIAVQNAAAFWARQGFNARTTTSRELMGKLASFGTDAALMSLTVGPG